ncbi:putative protease [Anaerosolibacter carboniphilus]|uniref:Putative protease n=1 Tax=Anaerosolibacter carboniphilus TaxID=1417629 RepID=A0A841KY17_9FIRM|nr:U32 family peptidase [Anaerosolibacter carboniphilus]MBB6218247.1 putative protease [Anaerosolibacter carboniphilus]
MREIELLAPAGSWEALVAAVQNGADAIYLGGKSFSARQSANNFDDEELIKAVSYCHIRGVKVFVTVNTLVSNDELKDFTTYISFLYNHDVDAVIVQDLGAAKLIRDLFPDFEIHASTQMSVHNLEGVKLLEELGFQRVVLAREMSVEEIKQVQDNCKADIEVFVHGALCICYSGQCLMSSMIGGRSGNRGRCAQPCRMPYQLINMRNGEVFKNEDGDYLLSPRDLNTLENIHQIVDTGVKSLKIEGRLKRAEYVATVVGAYRKAIDQYTMNKSKPKLDSATLKDVEQIFNRKFTKGYILGDYGKKIMSFEKPSNRGIKIGEVVGYDKNKQKVEIKLTDELRKGDGIEIWTEKGDSPGAIVEVLTVRGEKRETGNAKEIIQVNFKHSVSKGQFVYKTSDISLFQRARESFERIERKIPIEGAFHGKIGEHILLTLWDQEGHYVEIRGEYQVERALKRPTEEERVREQLMKLGNTPYVFESLEVQLDGDGIIPIGELNGLRRDAIKQLDDLRANHNGRQPVETRELRKKMDQWFVVSRGEQRSEVSLRVSVNNLTQLKAVLRFSVNRIYYTDFDTLEDASQLAKNHEVELVPSFSRITTDEELRDIKTFLSKNRNQVKGIMASNLGIVKVARDMGVEHIYGDFSLNVFNNGALMLLHEWGVEEAALSPELTLKQIKEIMEKVPIPGEVIVQGHLPLMIMRHCPTTAVLNKKGQQENCNLCRNSSLGLKDRKGMIFPVMMDRQCRTHILNSQSLCLIEHIQEILDGGVGNLRIHLTIEDEHQIEKMMEAYGQVLQRGMMTAAAEAFLKEMRERGLTKGHFYRGVQ